MGECGFFSLIAEPVSLMMLMEKASVKMKNSIDGSILGEWPEEKGLSQSSLG